MTDAQKELLEKAKKTIVTLLSNVVPAEQLQVVKDWVKLAETPPATPDPNAPAASKEIKTKDGKVLSITGELAVGSEIKEKAPEGLKDLADGDYVLIDDAGKELPISVIGGKIAEISTVQEEQKDPAEGEMAKQVATLTTQLSEQKKSNEKLITDLKTELASVKGQVVDLSNTLIKILEAPINLSAPKIEKKLDEMSNAEKVRFNRGEKIYHN